MVIDFDLEIFTDLELQLDLEIFTADSETI